MAGSLKFTLADFSIVKNWNMPRSETYEQLFGRSVQELSNLCPQILPILELENSSYFSKNEQVLRSKIPSLTATYENFLNQTDFLDDQTQLQQIGLDQAESTYSNWKNVAIAVPICATAAGLVIGWYIPNLIDYLKSTPKTKTSPM